MAELAHDFEVTKTAINSIRLEMSPAVADLLTSILHRVETGFLDDKEYLVFNVLRKQLSQATGRS